MVWGVTYYPKEVQSRQAQLQPVLDTNFPFLESGQIKHKKKTKAS